jgi:hypothetical protein
MSERRLQNTQAHMIDVACCSVELDGSAIVQRVQARKLAKSYARVRLLVKVNNKTAGRYENGGS